MDRRAPDRHILAMVRHALPFLLAVLFVGISFSHTGLAFRRAPAFDDTGRGGGVSGDWLVPDAWALYSAPDYLFQLAFGYRHADAVASGEAPGPDEIAGPRTVLACADAAGALLEENMALAPASARSWVALAWSEALLGGVAAARAALETSWELAPWNLGLTNQCVALADVLALLEPSLGDGAAWTAGMARDLETINRFGTSYRGTERRRVNDGPVRGCTGSQSAGRTRSGPCRLWTSRHGARGSRSRPASSAE